MEQWTKCNVNECPISITNVEMEEWEDEDTLLGFNTENFVLHALLTNHSNHEITCVYSLDVIGKEWFPDIFETVLADTMAVLAPKGTKKIECRKTLSVKGILKQIILKLTSVGINIHDEYRMTFNVNKEYVCELENTEWNKQQYTQLEKTNHNDLYKYLVILNSNNL